jgi:hypothetical protein
MWHPIDLVACAVLLVGIVWIWWAWSRATSDERRATSDPNLSGGMPRARAYLRIVAVGLALTVFALVMYLKTG